MKGVAAKTRNKYQAAFEMIAPLPLLYLHFFENQKRDSRPSHRNRRESSEPVEERIQRPRTGRPTLLRGRNGLGLSKKE